MSQPQQKMDLKLHSSSEVWDEEYSQNQVIPSSTRTLPSKVLVLFSELLRFDNKLKVLDAGCGIGRNSVYLAKKGCEVHAADFSFVALKRLEHLADESGVANRIITYQTAFEENFPFEHDVFDLVLDSYVFCHFVDENLKEYYLNELYRVTKPGGFVFSSVFSVNDEYYSEIVREDGETSTVVVDPRNRVTKQLYTEDKIKGFFSKMFAIRYFVEFQFHDLVLGKSYRRNIFALVLQK
jgi:ubiquinone/menaquinone biosynthesis C-methylase UbiE